MTYWRRAELVELQAATQAKLKPIQELMAPLSKEYREAVEAAKAAVQPEREKLIAISSVSREEAEKKIPLGAVDFPEEKWRELIKHADQARRIDVNELTPIAVKYALNGIEGLTIDGQAATLELLRQRGPDSLYDEISAAVQAEIELSPEERENLSSQSTSAGAVDGEKNPGSAIPAGKPDTTMSEDAPNFMVLVNAGAFGTGPVS